VRKLLLQQIDACFENAEMGCPGEGFKLAQDAGVQMKFQVSKITSGFGAVTG